MTISAETQTAIDHYTSVRDAIGAEDINVLRAMMNSMDTIVGTLIDLDDLPEEVQAGLGLICDILDPEGIAEQDEGFCEGCEGNDMSAFVCVDCSVNTDEINEYYMVHDEIWQNQAKMLPYGGMMCLGCLETRIGRQLTAKDFTDAPVNHGYFPRSERFLSRLGVAEEIAA